MDILEGFKLNWTNKESALKELQEQENIKQTKEQLNNIGIEVF